MAVSRNKCSSPSSTATHSGFYELLKYSYLLSAEKKQKSRQKEPQPHEEDADNEIMDLSDPERITKERGGWWHRKGPRYITLPQECDDTDPTVPC
jgi:hypothetical protein